MSASVRLTLADILEFFEIKSGDAFDVAPDDAISTFKLKGLKPTFSYADMLGVAHVQSFTVAKMMDVDMLGQVRTSLESALANGQSYKEWADGLVPMLQASGWWGKKQVFDPATGKMVEAQLGSAHRLQTIFRTNMQSAYAEQQWQMIESQKDVAPFLMYDAVDDFRTRPSHKARDNTILPADHPWWNKNTPPLGYQCRCGVIQLSQDELDALGKLPNKTPPAIGEYEWTNPRTGHTHTFPEGIDPGFDYNVGKFGIKQKLDKLLAEKVATLPPDMQKAAHEALAKGPLTNKAVEAAVAAQNAIAQAKAQAAIERAAAKAAEIAKQGEAKAQIKVISGSPAKGETLWMKKAYDLLVKTPGFENGSPVAQLDVIKAKAKQLSDKNKLAGTLSAYKLKVLDGKTPTPAQKAALDSLTPEEKDKFLAKIDAEKAAIVAKKADEKAAQAAKTVTEAPIVQPVAPPSLPQGAGPNMADLVQIGPQKGSNPGGLFQNTQTGEKWYIKTPASADIARNEVLAAKLYELAGIDVPELHLTQPNGKPSVASKIVDGLTKGEASALAKASGAADGFAVDAWLANWDVVGLGYDNLLLKGAKVMRVDTGGALRYRAQGGLKGTAFGDLVTELESLRDAGTNSQTASIFGKLSKAKIEASVARVLAIPDAQIRAMVNQFGPEDLAARKELADRLIARKKHLAKLYPKALVDEPPAPVSGAMQRVSDSEQSKIEAARVNGIGIKTDKDQIEDQMVVVSNYTNNSGTEMTRGWMKLRPDAAKQMLDKIQKTAGSNPTVHLSEARNSILATIKGINSQAKTGATYRDKDLTRLNEASKAAKDAVAKLQKGIRDATGPAKAKLEAQLTVFKEWADRIEQHKPLVIVGKPAMEIGGKFPNDQIPDFIEYSTGIQQVQAWLQWKKGGSLEFEVASFDRSSARFTGMQTAPGISEHYTAELPGGGRVIFIPDVDKNSGYALRGLVNIDVPGKSAVASARVFDEINGLGIDSTRATDVDRDHLYLNSFSRLMLSRKSQQWAEWQTLDRNASGADGVQKKLDYLKKATGVDIEKSDGWANRAGVYEAFDHGRAYQYRPDLETPEFREFEKKYLLYHNPMSLQKNVGNNGVWDESLKRVINGGGTYASGVDRLRRGVPLSTHAHQDIPTGGGSYFFTRVKSKTGKMSAGLYWKASRIRRMDVITYDSDKYGRTTPGHIEANRRGQTVKDFVDIANESTDESIFKNGLSVFDDLEFVVLKTKTELARAIAEMKQMGYDQWPDGRKLTDVFKWEGDFK